MLKALACTEHHVMGVMASHPKRGSGTATLWTAAQQLGYEVWPANLVKDPAFASTVRSKKVDVILNVHSLFVVHEDILQAVRVGAFNLHPGPLPQYAGLNVVSWAIYRNESTHGVTIHKMLPRIDAGPVVYQSIFAIEETDTALSVHSKCVKAGVPLALELVNTACQDPDAIPLSPQDLSKREYFGKTVPGGGRICWSRPAREVLNFVRACDYLPFPSPWGHPNARINDCDIGIVKASRTGQTCDVLPGTVGLITDGGIQIACGNEWILVYQLMVEGRRVRAVEMLKPGDRLEDAH
jgi:methionyl-tRNA formyltransferase